nr:11799_t:CDS:2 [Entrophospora candida]
MGMGINIKDLEEVEVYHDDIGNESSRKSQNILKSNILTPLQKPVSSDQIVKRMSERIIKPLDHYWQKPNQIALISTILDPRYKDLSFCQIIS